MKFIIALLLFTGCASTKKVCRPVCIPGEDCKTVCMTVEEWGF